jgi:hypothetical protein
MRFIIPPVVARSFSFVLPVAVGAAALLGSMAVSPHTARAQTLTDVVLFRTDANGNTISEGWNTRGGDFVSNLYLKSGADFINSGNGAAASIAIDLSVPNVYTFSFVGDNVNDNTTPPLGINFFFNNNASTPDISARGPQSGGFSANGATTNTPTFGTVAGANTLTFFNNGRQITLSAFSYQATGGPDQSSSFNNASNGVSDTNGTFTLTVSATAAPEPATLAILTPVLIGAGIVMRRRRTVPA